MTYTTKDFADTVIAQYNLNRSRTFAGGYEGVTHAGIAIVAADTGLILFAQRAMDETDAPDVQQTWEFPGGSLNPDEEPFPGAVRELLEETYLPLPEGLVVNGWRSTNGIYQCFVYLTPTQFPLDGWLPTDEVQAVAWMTPDQAMAAGIRPEMADFDWSLLDTTGMNTDAMVASAVSGNEDMMVEPDFSEIFAVPIPIHGVLAPEGVATGDKRGFMDGSMSKRSYRLPFRWQESDTGEHNGARVVGSVDRMMRKDGLIHYEGQLMPSDKTDQFVGLMEFFDGRYGVSVDGDNGSLDMAKSKTEGIAWFDAVRASGLTAVDIPAFSEAYVTFGPHPDMPAEGDAQYAVMVASGDLVGQTTATFDRGPGWVTDPAATKRIHDYWTKKGEAGYAKIGWGTPGDFRRAKALIGEKILKNSPEKARFLNQIIAQWHFDALGYWPGDLGKPGNAPNTPENRKRAAQHAASGETVAFKDYSPAERKKAHTIPGTDSFPIENCEDLKNAIQAIGRAKDPAAAKRHIRTQKSRLGCTDVALPESWASDGSLEVGQTLFEEAYEEGRITEVGERDDGAVLYDLAPEHGIVETEEEDAAWEAVLVSSAASRVRPPLEYFHEHPGSMGTVIEPPDKNGFRRTYGMAAEWGVCHIGHGNRCVEPPRTYSDDYPQFHKGFTRLDEGRIPTGVLTYNVEHRDAQTILTESATQSHFDNLKNAWAAVRIGENDRGIWFSGVVLPKVDEDDLTKIEASGQVSGEWKYGALRALLTVNVEGFEIQRPSAEYDELGNVVALAASAFGGVPDAPCAATPAERMAALRMVDAEEKAVQRMAALRQRLGA